MRQVHFISYSSNVHFILKSQQMAEVAESIRIKPKSVPMNPSPILPVKMFSPLAGAADASLSAPIIVPAVDPTIMKKTNTQNAIKSFLFIVITSFHTPLAWLDVSFCLHEQGSELFCVSFGHLGGDYSSFSVVNDTK